MSILWIGPYRKFSFEKRVFENRKMDLNLKIGLA